MVQQSGNPAYGLPRGSGSDFVDLCAHRIRCRLRLQPDSTYKPKRRNMFWPNTRETHCDILSYFAADK